MTGISNETHASRQNPRAVPPSQKMPTTFCVKKAPMRRVFLYFLGQKVKKARLQKEYTNIDE